MLSQVQSSQEPSHTPPEYQKLSGVAVGHRRHHGLERRGPLHRGQPLDRAGIGETEAADGTGGPRLAGGPLDGVVPVLALVTIGLELAGRAVTSSNVLQHHGIAAGDGGPDQFGCRTGASAVRGAVHQHRKPSVLRRAPEIGSEDDAVPHGHRNAGVHLDPRLGGQRLTADS